MEQSPKARQSMGDEAGGPRDLATFDEKQQDIAHEHHGDSAPAQSPPSPTAISTLKFTLTLIALLLSIFCVALDNTIIATAIPRITDTYHTLNDVGWYGSAYLLPTAALQPLYGKIYTYCPARLTFMIALFLFELGSLVSAVAPTSPAFIVGRTISGVGAAGIFSGALIIITMIVPLEKRPVYQSLIGGTFAFATITAPLIGGAFTDSVTWRWCFYLNLPIGGLSAALLLLFLKLPSIPRPKMALSLLWKFDPLGTILFLPSIICILLALQWGGITYPWSDGRMIALLVVFGGLLIAFIVVELYMGRDATIPPKIGGQRSVASASIFAFCNCGQFFVLIYFIPIYFQAIKGTNAEHSGIDTIPLIISNNIANILSGVLSTVFGHYVPYFYVCAIFSSIGSGLISTWQVNTSVGKWIGYQIIAGFGAGMAFQLPQVAVQPVLAPEDIPVGITTTLFMQFFGGALFISVGNNILNSKLIKYIGESDIPGVDPQRVIQLGATGLRQVVPAQYLPLVLSKYMEALRWTFRVSLVLACVSLLAALPMEWKTVKPPKTGVETAETSESPAEEVQ